MERQFSERQLIRWAVPGWITLFLVILLIFTHLLLSGGFRGLVWCNLPAGGTIAALGATVIAFGFALGFILFQIYFVLYWCNWKFCEKLVGGVVGYEQIFNALGSFKAKLKKYFGHWPAERNGVNTQRQQMEVSIVAAWWRAMEQKKGRMDIWESRNNYLVAVYHALGAILVGTYLIGLFYLAVYPTVMAPKLEHLGFVEIWLPYIINLVLLVLWGIVLWRGRSNTEVSHRNLTKHALHYFYQQERDKGNKA